MKDSPDLYSDVRISDVAYWIKTIADIPENLCKIIKINFSGDPFGVNGIYQISYRLNRKGWVRDGFRIYPATRAGRPIWFLAPDGQRKNFLKAHRKSECPSG